MNRLPTIVRMAMARVVVIGTPRRPLICTEGAISVAMDLIPTDVQCTGAAL